MDRKYDLDYEKLILYEYNMKKFVKTVLKYCEKKQEFWQSYIEDHISKSPIITAPTPAHFIDLERSEFLGRNIEKIHHSIQQ